MQGLSEFFIKDNKKTILFIDEADMLNCTSQHVFYWIFQWTKIARKNLKVILVSNNLGFLRDNPRIESQIQENLLVFPHYSKEQLLDILVDRVGVDHHDLF